MINQNIFTQFPAWVITNHKLSNFQFRLYTLLEYFRFTKQTDLTSETIAQYLIPLDKKIKFKSFRDYIRRELNRFNDIFPQEFLRIYFKKKALNTPHEIIIHFNYLTTQIKISDKMEVNFSDKLSLSHFLKNSKYFSEIKPDELLNMIQTDFENLLKALIYCDSRNNLREPIRYLRSCFKDKVFKYDKKELELEKFDIDKTDYSKRLKKLARIDSPLLYGITNEYAELLKHTKDENYIFYGIKDKNHFLIYRCTYHTKEANPKTALEKHKIPYQIFLRNKP